MNLQKAQEPFLKKLRVCIRVRDPNVGSAVQQGSPCKYLINRRHVPCRFDIEAVDDVIENLHPQWVKAYWLNSQICALSHHSAVAGVGTLCFTTDCDEVLLSVESLLRFPWELPYRIIIQLGQTDVCQSVSSIAARVVLPWPLRERDAGV